MAGGVEEGEGAHGAVLLTPPIHHQRGHGAIQGGLHVMPLPVADNVWCSDSDCLLAEVEGEGETVGGEVDGNEVGWVGASGISWSAPTVIDDSLAGLGVEVKGDNLELAGDKLGQPVVGLSKELCRVPSAAKPSPTTQPQLCGVEGSTVHTHVSDAAIDGLLTTKHEGGGSSGGAVGGPHSDGLGGGLVQLNVEGGLAICEGQ